MESPLNYLRFAQFQFFLKALDCINLPVYKGSTFRGGFGHAFKKVVWGQATEIFYQLGLYLNKEIGKVFGVGYTAVPGADEDQTPRSSKGLGTPWPPC